MVDTLIKHADILTLDPSETFLYDAEIAISGGVIAAVGAAPPGFEPDEVVDARRRIAMPAFFNAHTHSPMVLFRGRGPALALNAWLEDRAWLARSGLSGDDVYWGAALAACEMIRSGVVGYADQYYHMDRVAVVVAASGLRADLSWCTFGGEEGEIGTDLAGVAAFVEDWQGAGEGRIRTALAPHARDLCNPVFLARTAAVAARLGVPIRLHLAQSQQKVDEALALYDMTPVEVLNRNGVFDVPATAAQCVYVNENDCEILASKGVAAVDCPTSQARLGLGNTPVGSLRAAGVAVALGGGEPTAGGRLGMLGEVRRSALRQSGAAAAGSTSPEQMALAMATRDAARALGFGTSGLVAPGYTADLILVDRDNERLLGGERLADLVVYSAQEGDISDVMAGGKWLMRDRRLLTLDEAAIRYEAERRGRRLTGDQKNTAGL